MVPWDSTPTGKGATQNQGAVLAHAFPQKFDRGTRGWFLRMTVGSPVPRKKNSGVLRQGMRAISCPTVNHIDK